MPRKVEISHRTIIFTVLFLGFAWFLFLIHNIILSIFVAILIMSILNPLVKRLYKYRVPRGVSVLIVYLVVFGLIGGSLASIIPGLIEQTSNLANKFPHYLSNLPISSSLLDQIYSQLIPQIGNLPGKIVGVVLSVLSNFVEILTILTFAFYLLLARDKIDNQLEFVFGESRSKQIVDFLDELEVKLGGWSRGQLILMVTVGIFSYVGLTILGIPFALPLAILAGFLEAVPYIGPIIAAVPAIIVGFGISPVMGVGASVLAFLIQQVENYILVPKIMEKSVGVSPIVTLLSLAIGARIAGITGVLISIPVVILIKVLIKKHPIFR